MDRLIFVLIFLGALGTALLAGNFFAFSAFLLKALNGLTAERGIVAMQAITAATRGSVSAALFFGTAALCALLAAAALYRWGAPGSCTLLAGALFYLLGAFPVTMLRSIPLNRVLAGAAPDAKDARAQWNRYRSAWSLWNHARTALALAACASLILALVAMGNPFGAA